MVRAILDGRKTMTRRVVRPQPANGWAPENPPVVGRITSAHPKRDRFGVFLRRGLGTDFPQADLVPCPYGAPGDRLWVREAFALETCAEGEDPPFDDGRPVVRRPDDDIDGCHPLWVQAHYRATDPVPDLCCDREGCAQCRDHDMGPHWRPSIHMPRWASRITLEMTDIRVTRLQAISEADAIAEGILRDGDGWRAAPDLPWYASPIAAFRSLWEAINGAGGWDDNPWVWVVEFKRLEAARG